MFRELFRRLHEPKLVAACLLLALISGSCATGDANRGFKDSNRDFKGELAAAIEQMLQQREEIVSARRSRELQGGDLPTGTGQTRLNRRWYVPVADVAPSDLLDSYGARREGGRRHEGIDIRAPRGQPVVAATDGVVKLLANTVRGGRCLWLLTDDGYELYYAHLDGWRPGLEEGARVRAGVMVGYVGNSGNASGSGCHLHFEIHDSAGNLNPYPILIRAEAFANAPRRTSRAVSSSAR